MSSGGRGRSSRESQRKSQTGLTIRMTKGDPITESTRAGTALGPRAPSIHVVFFLPSFPLTFLVSSSNRDLFLILLSRGSSSSSVNASALALVLVLSSTPFFFALCLSSSYPSPLRAPPAPLSTLLRTSPNSSSNPPLLLFRPTPPPPPSSAPRAKSSSSRSRLRLSRLLRTTRPKFSSSNSSRRFKCLALDERSAGVLPKPEVDSTCGTDGSCSDLKAVGTGCDRLDFDFGAAV